MSVPTGPAVVGLEMLVLPAEVQLEPNDGRLPTCWVTAPACRYGRVVYRPQIRFTLGGGGSILEVDGEETIAGGTRAECALEDEYPVQRVNLFVVSIAFDSSTLSRLTPAALAEVLAHPWRSIREAALLALGQ